MVAVNLAAAAAVTVHPLSLFIICVSASVQRSRRMRLRRM